MLVVLLSNGQKKLSRKLTMTEHEHQVELVRWSRLAAGRYPDLLKLFAVPNGGLEMAKLYAGMR